MRYTGNLFRLRAWTRATRGVTLVEMFVVMIIIGILVTVSLPNIYSIIQMSRLRTSGNDLLVKARYARSLAIQAHRRITMEFDMTRKSFALKTTGHTEYDLMEDIPSAVAAGQDIGDTSDPKYILYIEKAGKICNETWNPARVSSTECAYYIGESPRSNGIDSMGTTCTANQLVFEPSGVMNQATCVIQLTNDRLKRTYTVKVYKGGQMVLQ